MDIPAAVESISQELGSRVEQLADQLLGAYQARIPSYATASQDALVDARRWAGNSITVATGIVTGNLNAEDFSEALTDIGRRRARQGFPLHDVLLANLIATEHLWKWVMAAAPDDPDERLEVQTVFMDATVSLLQHAVAGLAAGYLEVEEARVADEEHDMQTLVETLAGLREPDRRHTERAEDRAVDLDALRWCVVVRTEKDIGHHVRALRRLTAGAAVGRIGRRIIAYLPGDEPPRIEVAPAGISSARDTVAGYRRASSALQVALHLGNPQVMYEEVVPLAMILSGPDQDREAFVEAQLGPLLTDSLGDELMKTLDAFYRSGQSVASAARDLYVHRHTLEYRLSRVEAALDRDIRAPENRILLELALALREEKPA